MTAPADFSVTKFYPLTILHFFLHFFSFISDNCKYGSLLRKCLKMKTFLLLTIIYSKTNINIVKVARVVNLKLVFTD